MPADLTAVLTHPSNPFRILDLTFSSSLLKKSNNSDEKLDKNTQFELIYTQNEKNELIKIIDKNFSKDYDFDVYTYGGDVLININGKSYDFKEALLQNIISIDNILEKANDDAQNDICTEAKYLIQS